MGIFVTQPNVWGLPLLQVKGGNPTYFSVVNLVPYVEGTVSPLAEYRGPLKCQQ